MLIVSGHKKATPKHVGTFDQSKKLKPPNGFDKFYYNPKAKGLREPKDIAPI
jgi:hypothetical protein